MKRFVALLCAVLLTLSLAACGGDKGSNKTADPAALADAMLEALGVQGEMMEVTGDVAANYYSMGDEVKDYRIYLSTMYIAEEVAVFRLADAKDADAVKKLCESRIQDLKDSFDGYLQEEYDTVSETATVRAAGDSVAMVTGTTDGVAAAKAAFDKTVK